MFWILLCKYRKEITIAIYFFPWGKIIALWIFYSVFSCWKNHPQYQGNLKGLYRFGHHKCNLDNLALLIVFIVLKKNNMNYML